MLAVSSYSDVFLGCSSYDAYAHLEIDGDTQVVILISSLRYELRVEGKSSHGRNHRGILLTEVRRHHFQNFRGSYYFQINTFLCGSPYGSFLRRVGITRSQAKKTGPPNLLQPALPTGSFTQPLQQAHFAPQEPSLPIIRRSKRARSTAGLPSSLSALEPLQKQKMQVILPPSTDEIIAAADVDLPPAAENPSTIVENYLDESQEARSRSGDFDVDYHYDDDDDYDDDYYDYYDYYDDDSEAISETGELDESDIALLDSDKEGYSFSDQSASTSAIDTMLKNEDKPSGRVVLALPHLQLILETMKQGSSTKPTTAQIDKIIRSMRSKHSVTGTRVRFSVDNQNLRKQIATEWDTIMRGSAPDWDQQAAKKNMTGHKRVGIALARLKNPRLDDQQAWARYLVDWQDFWTAATPEVRRLRESWEILAQSGGAKLATVQAGSKLAVVKEADAKKFVAQEVQHNLSLNSLKQEEIRQAAWMIKQTAAMLQASCVLFANKFDIIPETLKLLAVEILTSAEKVQFGLLPNVQPISGVSTSTTPQKCSHNQTEVNCHEILLVDDEGESAGPHILQNMRTRRTTRRQVRWDTSDEELDRLAALALLQTVPPTHTLEWFKANFREIRSSLHIRHSLLENPDQWRIMECGGDGDCGPLSFRAALCYLHRNAPSFNPPTVKTLRSQVRDNTSSTNRDADYKWLKEWWNTTDLLDAARVHQINLVMIRSNAASFGTLLESAMFGGLSSESLFIFGGAETASTDPNLKRFQSPTVGRGEAHWRIVFPPQEQEALDFLAVKCQVRASQKGSSLDTIKTAWERQNVSLNSLREDEASGAH